MSAASKACQQRTCALARGVRGIVRVRTRSLRVAQRRGCVRLLFRMRGADGGLVLLRVCDG